MKIIISPTKKMKEQEDELSIRGLPCFLKEAEQLKAYMQGLTYTEAKAIWKCNDAIAKQNYRRYEQMELEKRLSPAVLTYEGIQFQYMAPQVMREEELEYLQEHLRILSGFYGIVKPFDGITPYRLEMQAKLKLSQKEKEVTTLYEFWGDRIYNQLVEEDSCILNLASKEYSKCIETYLLKGQQFVTCVFGSLVVDANGKEKVKTKATEAKMARGEMVRYLAQNQIKTLEEVKKFSGQGFQYNESRSKENEYVFIKR